MKSHFEKNDPVIYGLMPYGIIKPEWVKQMLIYNWQ